MAAPLVALTLLPAPLGTAAAASGAHMHMTLSSPPLARCWPSGLKATARTVEVWPCGATQGLHRRTQATQRASVTHTSQTATNGTGTCTTESCDKKATIYQTLTRACHTCCSI